MTLGEQRRKALELLAPPPSRRHGACERHARVIGEWLAAEARYLVS